MKARFFFVPATDGSGWELVEARSTAEGWELRRPGRFGAQAVAVVPPEGADWVEAAAPTRKPHVAKAGGAQSAGHAARTPALRVAVAPDPPKDPPPRPAASKKAVPKLSSEILGLLAAQQKAEPAPKGKVKCPACGLVLDPMKVKKVRTHDDPVRGLRCEGSGQRLAG